MYGITPAEVGNYDANYFVVDDGPVFPDNPEGVYGGDPPVSVPTYDASRSGYMGLLAGGVIFLVVGLLLVVVGYKLHASDDKIMA